MKSAVTHDLKDRQSIFDFNSNTLKSGIAGDPRLLIFQIFSNLPTVIKDSPLLIYGNLSKLPVYYRLRTYKNMHYFITENLNYAMTGKIYTCTYFWSW